MSSSTYLEREISAIWAIDNHTHMGRLWRYDKPVDFKKKVSSIVRYLIEKPSAKLKVGGGALLPLREFEYREIINALKALYGFESDLITKEYAEELTSKILDSRMKGLAYVYSNALDKAGIDIALINTPELRRELDKKRFKWVPFVDQFLYPLKKANAYLRVKATWTFERFEKELDFIYQKANVQPETFDDYLSLVEGELKEYKNKGAVAVKFWSAFFRSLYFSKVDEAEAKKVFKWYMSNEPLTETEYVRLQDFIARKVLSICRDLNLPVHIHVGFGLANDVITLSNSSPINLENIAEDKSFEELKIVLIHGGYPYVREAGSLARMRENVFIDFSWLPVLIPPSELSFILREWIAWKLEDKLLFGTDAVEAPWGTDDLLCVYGARQARKALTITLSKMIDDHILSPNEAVTIAKKALRENALELYNF